jgi:crossover junction endodeoxyribonuclease RusA
MILLPYPPSLNRAYRNFRGRMVKSSVASTYFDLVAKLARQHGIELHTGPVAVDVELCPPKPNDWEKRKAKDPNAALQVRRIDLDNALKVCLDSLQGVAYNNDKQITALMVRLGEPVSQGAMTVMVSPDRRWS